MSASLGAPRMSPVAVAKSILATQGWRGFYRGLAPVTLRAFPVNASALYVYEGLMRVLDAEKVRNNRTHILSQPFIFAIDQNLTASTPAGVASVSMRVLFGQNAAFSVCLFCGLSRWMD